VVTRKHGNASKGPTDDQVVQFDPSVLTYRHKTSWVVITR